MMRTKDARSARDTPVSDIMTTPVRCAAPEMKLDELTALFLKASISAVPVLDGEGMVAGIVSKTDLLRRFHEAGVELGDGVNPIRTEAGVAVDLGSAHERDLKGVTVADIMSHLVFTLTAEASISRAAAIMSYEGVHRLIVTSPGGMPNGLVSSLDVLRWLARNDGYVIPDLNRQQMSAHGSSNDG